MSIWLEDSIKEAILAVRWKQVGDNICPHYFVNARPDAVRFNNASAGWLAKFIANRLEFKTPAELDDSETDGLDKYSLEVVATYLEDHGYIVSSPE